MYSRIVFICHYLVLSLLIPFQSPAQKRTDPDVFTVNEGLSENVVHGLMQDRKGFIWIGTHEGLNRFDGYTFKKFLHDKNDSSSLPNSPIESLYQDDVGDIYVYSTAGPAKLDVVTGRFSWLGIDIMNFHNEVNRQLQGQLLFPVSFNVDLFWYPRKKNNSLFLIRDHQKKFLSTHDPECAFFDKLSRLWVIVDTQLLLIDTNGSQQIILNNLEKINAAAPLTGLINDSNGNLWIKRANKLIVLDEETGKLKVEFDKSRVQQDPNHSVGSLLLDRTNVVWAGSFYGLKKMNLENNLFQHFTAGENGKGMASNFVLGLNFSGNKLVAQHYYADSLYSVIDPTNKSIRQLEIHRSPASKFLKTAIVKNADRLKEDEFSRQVGSLISKKLDFQYLRYAWADQRSVIWLIWHLERLINLSDNREIEFKGTAQAIEEDDHYLWIVTSENGLLRYDKSNSQVKSYRAGNIPDGLSTDNLLSICKDKSGNLWIGSRGGGLNFFDKRKESFLHFSEKDGLSNNTIYSILFDNDHVWMGTANGLSCFNIITREFQNFYHGDGLVNIEYNRWSAVRGTDGTLYFGGMNGIDYFNPAEVLKKRSVVLPVQITAFKTGNEFQQLQSRIRLHHRQNFISFEFAAMDYRNPTATRYQYQLEGVSKEWINTESNHTAVFASLQPGNYVFRVRAAPQNGNWGPEESISFRIMAPWWQQAWFYALCILAIGGTLYTIYRFRVRQLRQLYLLRTKISQDLHDEMGATLTSISFLSEVASKQTTTSNSAAAQTVNKIGEYSRSMIGEMNDIVWAINPNNDKFEKIEDRIRNFATPLLAAKNIHFEFHSDDHLKWVTLNMQQRKNLYLIFKEAVNNAAKYSGAKQVDVRMTRENGHIQLFIKDNGSGFDEKQVQPGNGLTNMHERAKEIRSMIMIHSQPGHGTAINLIMPIA